MASDLMLRAGKAAGWVVVSRWFDLIGSLVTLAITARLLPPETFGIFGMAMLACLIPELVLSGALGDGVIQRKDLRPGHLNGVFWLHVVLFLVFMAGLFLMTPLFAAQFDQPMLTDIIPVMALSIVFWVLSVVPGALLRRELRFGALCVADALSTAAAFIVGVGMALMGFGVWSLVWQEIARRCVKWIAMSISARWAPSVTFTRADVTDLLRFNVLGLATRIIYELETAIPKYFIGLFLGAQMLGYFNMAVRFYQQLTQVLLSPFTSVALPVIASIQHDREQLHATFAAGTKAATMLAFPAFIGAAAVAPVAIPLIFGETWIPAIPAAQIMIIAAVRAPVNAFNGELMRGTGHPGIYTTLVGLGAIMMAVMVPLVTSFGIAAVSLTILVRGIVQWAVAAYVVQRTVGYPAIKQFTIGWQSFIAAAGMGIVVALALPWLEFLPRPVSLGLLGLLGVVVHMALLSILAPQLAKRLLSFFVALARRDKKSLTRILGLT
ncbi:MAG: lipopolysaccharide biosynthesis protein [Alphaproteobacteria bacterium]|jgi:lipopolysaccharide exporter|nr:MAG: lipopolysaccharide biosynthesis protein [Alphaproteobacteria bacterium]